MILNYKCSVCGHMQGGKFRCCSCGSTDMIDCYGNSVTDPVYSYSSFSNNSDTSVMSYNNKTKEYKVIPGPKNIIIYGNNPTNAFLTFENIISSNAVDGWEYYSMETLSVTQMTGCLGITPVVTNCYMLIFVRDIDHVN